MSRHSHIAGLRHAVPSAGGFEGQPIANFYSVRIYSCSLQLIDVQKRIRSAIFVFDEPEAAVCIPHFQFAGGHPIFPFLARSRPGAGRLPNSKVWRDARPSRDDPSCRGGSGLRGGSGWRDGGGVGGLGDAGGRDGSGSRDGIELPP
jgi:hypothetical protein